MMISRKQKRYIGIGLIIGMLVVGAFFIFMNKPKEHSLSTTRWEDTVYPSPSKTVTATYPASILDLENWKITVPIGNEEKPTEIKQPQLATYMLDPWFVVTSDNAVRFRAPVSAVTTKGSNYPRSELREMTNNGRTNASWSSSKGTHTMRIVQAVTALPEYKSHVVAGQIHDKDEDIIVVRLEDTLLYVNVDGENMYTLDKNYHLGKRFTVTFVVKNNQTQVFYNDGQQPVYTLRKSYSGAYFKAGAYTQSNCSREQNPSLCKEDNYGEVVIYDVDVTHS